MKVVIPIKSCSSRVQNKNFRPFYKNYSLTDLLIKKLINVVSPENIYLSCEDSSKKYISDKYGVKFILRSEELVSNEVPMSKVITEIVKRIPGDDDIMWCLVTDPLFNDFHNVISTWNTLDHYKYDSLVVVYPFQEYILDSNYNPIDFGFGEFHVPSQHLKIKYRLNNTLFIIKRNALYENKYYIGSNPYWYHANNLSVDIDTENDFKLAKIIYEGLNSI